LPESGAQHGGRAKILSGYASYFCAVRSYYNAWQTDTCLRAIWQLASYALFCGGISFF
jgi:hypothetical protein